MKEAVLVTETIASHFEKQTPTLVDSVESELYCPLTMIPTIYGVKLLDHVRLGSSVCCQLHDHFKAAAPITFKWYKTPVSFSANVQMEISATLKKVIASENHGLVSRISAHLLQHFAAFLQSTELGERCHRVAY